MWFSLYRYIGLLFLLVVNTIGYSQNETAYTRTITSSQLIREIQEPGDRYVLRGAVITSDSFLFNDTITIDRKILITGCKYDNTRLLNIQNVHFKQEVIIFKTENLGVFFRNCQFDNLVRWDFSSTPNAVFVDCEFNGHFNFFNTSGALQLINSRFEYLVGSEEQVFQQLNVDPWNKTLKKLTLENTQFISPIDTQLVYITGDIDNLMINQCNFESLLSFYSCSINQTFTVERCKFKHPIGFDRTSFPEIETSFQFDQLAGFKIALYDNFDGAAYQAKGQEQLADSNIYRFNELMSIYSKLLMSYKARGDRVSSNACYVEMKDLETGRLKYLSENHGTLTSRLNYQLNRFLKFFAAYGTSPVRAIQVSIYVILLFALIYFFVYSEWDQINRRFLMEKYGFLQLYLSSPKSLAELYQEQEEENRELDLQFENDFRRLKSRVPAFINTLGRPLLYITRTAHRLRLFFYLKMEILRGKWSDVPDNKRPIKGFLLGLMVFVYMGYLIAIRAINSTILSVNTFSTLGFGDIPVKGISRYMAILEGFLGWFLLSIFSVSLISQILQG